MAHYAAARRGASLPRLALVSKSNINPWMAFASCRLESSSTTDSDKPWGLTPKYHKALPPALVCVLDKAVLQGLLNRPTWQATDAAAFARSYVDFLATPRDAFILHSALQMTLGDIDKLDKATAADAVEAAEGEGQSKTQGSATADAAQRQNNNNNIDIAKWKRALSMPPPVEDISQDPFAGLLNSPQVHAFLDSASDVFSQLFGAGPKSVTTTQLESAKELMHPQVLAAFQKAGSALPSQPIRVLASRIVDFHGVWDGTASAGDFESANCTVRQVGHSVALETKRHSGIITRLLSQAAHYYQLHPARSVTARVTVAFVCAETQADGEAAGTQLPSWLLSRDTAGAGEDAADAGSAGGAERKRKRRWSPRRLADKPADKPESMDVAQQENTPALIVSRLSSNFPLDVLDVATKLVRCSGPTSKMEFTPRHATQDAESGVKVTVHTVTFETQGAGTDFRFKPFRYMFPSVLRCTQGWKIVDVDGHFASPGLSHCSRWHSILQKAAERADWEMQNVIADTLPGGFDTAEAIHKLGNHMEHIGDAMTKLVVVKGKPELWVQMQELIAYTRAFATEVSCKHSAHPWQHRVEIERQLEKDEADGKLDDGTRDAATHRPDMLSIGSAVVAGRVVLEPRADLARLYHLLHEVEQVNGAIPLGTKLQLKLAHRAFVNFNEIVQKAFMCEMITHVCIPSLVSTLTTDLQPSSGDKLAKLLTRALDLQERAKDARIFQIALTASFEAPSEAVTGEQTSEQMRDEFYTDLLRLLNDYQEELTAAAKPKADSVE